MLTGLCLKFSYKLTHLEVALKDNKFSSNCKLKLVMLLLCSFSQSVNV